MSSRSWLAATALVSALAVACEEDKLVDISCQPGTKRPCYDGADGTAGVGLCRSGWRECVGGEWSKECRGQTLPGSETCDGQDNNCDGRTDEHLFNACGVCGPAVEGLGDACSDERGCPGHLACAASNVTAECSIAPGCVVPDPSPDGRVVISEICPFRTLGGPEDEFVEIYNTGRNPVDVSGRSLWYRRVGYSIDFRKLFTFAPGTRLAGRGYRLVASDGSYDRDFVPDGYFDAGISGLEGSIWLVANDEQPVGLGDPDVLDLVGWGEDSEESAAEGTPFNPGRGGFSGGGSIERKAHANATADSMSTGADARAGNAHDTNDNSVDFVLRDEEGPQTSQSPAEP